MKKLLLLFCFIAAILATSCSKEYGSGYDGTEWTGKRDAEMWSASFSEKGNKCIIGHGWENMSGFGLVECEVKWSSRGQFMLYEVLVFPGQEIDPPRYAYSGSISGDSMTLEHVDGTFACELTRKKI